MASNQTANYRLSQWEAEDAVRRVDFNADNAKIDAALKAVNQRLDGKADASVVDGLSQTVAGHTGTLSSHAGSISHLGNCQVYNGSYTGDGGATKSLSFPGYPVFVLIQDAGYGSQFLLRGAERPLGDYNHVSMSATWTPRGVSWTYPNADSSGAPFNRSGAVYTVLALLDMSK